jgi:hypothetical protein
LFSALQLTALTLCFPALIVRDCAAHIAESPFSCQGL